jgi:crossover junction endodeoxyribonuclease RuvC
VRVLGIDPGVTGGLAVLDEGRLIAICRMPVADSRASGSILADLLRGFEPHMVVVERTQPMPKNGSIASFSLGLNTGVIFGVVETLGHPMTKIRPADWKKVNGLTGKDKNASRHLAMELWPDQREQFRLAKDDGKAEAALIARAYVYLWIKEQHAASTVSE